MNEYEEFKQQIEKEHNTKIVDEARAYNQRLEDRLTKFEHAVTVIAQVVAQHMIGAQLHTHIYNQDSYNKIISVIADLIPEPESEPEKHSDTEPDPKHGYGWSEKAE